MSFIIAFLSLVVVNKNHYKIPSFQSSQLMIAQSYKSATKAIIVFLAVCHIFSAAAYKKKNQK